MLERKDYFSFLGLLLSLQDLWRCRFHRCLAASPYSTREIALCDDARVQEGKKKNKKIKSIWFYAAGPYLPRASHLFAPVLSRVICPFEQTLLHPRALNVAADVLFTLIVGTVLMLAWNCICVESFYLCLFVCFFLLQSMFHMLCKCTCTFNLQHTCVAVRVQNVFLHP